MKKVLVYPCGTEIGLEIYKSLEKDIHYEIWGGSSSYDHGRFVFENHIDDLPFIKDSSTKEEIIFFTKAISSYHFDYIYPAMDGVLTVFSEYRDLFTSIVVAPNFQTCEITRSKKKTYNLLGKILKTPRIFDSVEDILEYPVFSKPDIGQGAVGTKKIANIEEAEKEFSKKGQLLLEYLPGEEYTIDCFTNFAGKLIYAKARGRNRIKNGISVNAKFCREQKRFLELAEQINRQIKQRGGWFFQLKEDKNGELVLLEVASRIAGTSAITRAIGVNLPLLTLNDFSGQSIEEVIVNDFKVELDRALYNSFRTNLQYDKVYLDYDDTLVGKEGINLEIIKFLFQCINKGIKLYLISRHEGDLLEDLKRYRLECIFDEVIHIDRQVGKKEFVDPCNSIFIDDSYRERLEIFNAYHIPVFDIHSVDVLMEG